MDQKGSLVNTQLKIFPTKNLLAFLQNILDEDDIPYNILKVIGKDGNETSNFNFNPVNTQITLNDLKNLKNIRETVINEVIENAEVIKESPKVVANEVDPKLIKTGTKSTNDDESLETKDEDKKKIPFRDTSDLDWHEEGDLPEEVKQVEEIIPQIPYLTTPDIDWLYNYLQSKKSNNIDVPYLHELLAGANIEVPDNKVIKRNPILEARCVKLRKQQEAREYRKMTKTVDNVRLKFPEDSIAYQSKH